MGTMALAEALIRSTQEKVRWGEAAVPPLHPPLLEAIEEVNGVTMKPVSENCILTPNLLSKCSQPLKRFSF